MARCIVLHSIPRVIDPVHRLSGLPRAVVESIAWFEWFEWNGVLQNGNGQCPYVHTQTFLRMSLNSVLMLCHAVVRLQTNFEMLQNDGYGCLNSQTVFSTECIAEYLRRWTQWWNIKFDGNNRECTLYPHTLCFHVRAWSGAHSTMCAVQSYGVVSLTMASCHRRVPLIAGVMLQLYQPQKQGGTDFFVK